MTPISMTDRAVELAALDVASADALGCAHVAGLVRQLEGWLASVKIAVTRRLGELHADGASWRPK